MDSTFHLPDIITADPDSREKPKTMLPAIIGLFLYLLLEKIFFVVDSPKKLKFSLKYQKNWTYLLIKQENKRKKKKQTLTKKR